MKWLITFAASVIFCVSCYGECAGAGALKELLGQWFDRLSWSEVDGFTVKVRQEYPPYIFFEHDCYNLLSTDNGLLCLERGKPYYFTLGCGVGQRLRFVDPLTEETNSVVCRAFGRDVPTLYFEQQETSEFGDKPDVSRPFVISAKGEVYDVNRNVKCSFELPFVGLARKSMREESKAKARKDVCTAAQGNIQAGHGDLSQVRGWIEKNLTRISGMTNGMVEVCYFEPDNRCEYYNLFMADPTVSDDYREIVKRKFQQDQQAIIDERRWARLRILNGKVNVECVRVGFKGGEYRLTRFNQDGRAESVLYFTPSDEGLKRAEQKMLFGFDDKEELAFFLHLIDGKGINSFLVREQNDYVESKDEARAKKLMDDAMEYACRFKCEKL